MASLNKVFLLGNLGKDPEVRYTQAGTAVASFSLATSEKFKGKDGEWQEKTEWHNVVLWGRTAEIAGEYLSKGKSVLIEGRIQTRKWQDKEGNDRYSTEIVGDKLTMLGGGRGEGEGGGSRGGSSGRPARDNSGYGAGSYEEPVFNPDDEIPFS